MNRRALLGVLAGFAVAGLLSGQGNPAPSPTAKAPSKPARSKPLGPALNFSGVWELDMKESRGVTPNMRNAVLEVRQEGNRITISPLEQDAIHLMAEQIVVDGKPYEKNLGPSKGTVTAQWGTDGSSLWLQVDAGSPKDAQHTFQRMVWRLRDFGNTWTRQSWTRSEGKNTQSLLIFRRRQPGKARTPSPGAPAPPPRTP